LGFNYGGTNHSNQVLCEKNFQVEELRVMNEDQEGQTLKPRDVTPGVTPYISNKYKNSNLGMPNPAHSNHLDHQVSKPSYMAIKKALYGRQSGYFCFDFLCVLLL
jgi:hypothetical protein